MTAEEREAVQALLGLAEAAESADAHYRACQSDLFRHFLMAHLRARSVERARAVLGTRLRDKTKGESEDGS